MNALRFAASLLVLLPSLIAVTSSQTAPAAQHEANFDAERKQADDLFTKGFYLQAMPLYEDLSRQDPTVAVFAERLGTGLVAAANAENDAAKKQSLMARSYKEFHRAQALGDNSPAMQYALGAEPNKKGDAADPGYANNLPSAAIMTEDPKVQALMHEAETAFAQHDTATAFAKYKQAAEVDPHFYLANLYAGDACFSGGDYACAEEWFAKAIAIDPTIETAYRYWGDALYKSGHSAEAKVKYEEAILANPYTKLSWDGLAQYGAATHTAMSSPPILRPTIDLARPAAGQPQAKVNMPKGLSAENVEDVAVWTAYAKCRVNIEVALPAGGHRSAEGEVGCLKAAADVAAAEIAAGNAKRETLTPGVQSLLALSNDGMLECWLLLNGGDQDVTRDYAAYREGHHDLLIAYIDKYVIHATPPA